MRTWLPHTCVASAPVSGRYGWRRWRRGIEAGSVDMHCLLGSQTDTTPYDPTAAVSLYLYISISLCYLRNVVHVPEATAPQRRAILYAHVLSCRFASCGSSRTAIKLRTCTADDGSPLPATLAAAYPLHSFTVTRATPSSLHPVPSPPPDGYFKPQVGAIGEV